MLDTGYSIRPPTWKKQRGKGEKKKRRIPLSPLPLFPFSPFHFMRHNV
jgi:hypothetical protein